MGEAVAEAPAQQAPGTVAHQSAHARRAAVLSCKRVWVICVRRIGLAKGLAEDRPRWLHRAGAGSATGWRQATVFADSQKTGAGDIAERVTPLQRQWRRNAQPPAVAAEEPLRANPLLLREVCNKWTSG